MRSEALLQVRQLRRHFPVHNVFGLRSGTIKALDDVTLRCAAGRDVRHRRGVGLRQDDARQDAGRHPQAERGPYPVRRCRHLGLAGAARGPVIQRLQYIHQDPGNALDPRWTIGRSPRRAAGHPHGVESLRARRTQPRDPGCGRAATGTSGALSARAVRRPAAPRRPRPHPDAQASARHSRRANLRSGCVDAGHRLAAVALAAEGV